MSRPNVAECQYLGVGKFTLGLEWNCGRKARKGHICEDTFAYGSYSSKDINPGKWDSILSYILNTERMNTSHGDSAKLCNDLNSYNTNFKLRAEVVAMLRRIMPTG